MFLSIVSGGGLTGFLLSTSLSLVNSDRSLAIEIRAEQGESFRLAAINSDASIVALIGDKKELRVVHLRMESSSWKIPLRKTATAVAFASDGSILISENSGDVYQVHADCKKLKFILGHVSIVNSLLVTGQLIFTCDRDEKIRASRFPDAYRIEAFLLGHRRYVRAMHLLPGDRLAAGGGDDYVSIWSVGGFSLARKVPLPFSDVFLLASLGSVLYVAAENESRVFKIDLADSSDSGSVLQLPGLVSAMCTSAGSIWISCFEENALLCDSELVSLPFLCSTPKEPLRGLFISKHQRKNPPSAE